MVVLDVFFADVVTVEDIDVFDETFVVAIFILDSELGDDGGEVFISSNGGVFDLAFGAPFNAELLANCKYADNLGNISLTSSISLLKKKQKIYIRFIFNKTCHKKE